MHNRLYDCRYSSQSAAEMEEVDATWRDYSLAVEASSEGSMASELWVRAAVRFKRDRDFRMGILRVFSCSYHWTRVMILARVKF